MSPRSCWPPWRRLGGSVERVFVVGCQPASLDEGIGLSPPVAAAVDGAVELCRRLMDEIVQPAGKGNRRMIVRFVVSLVLALIAGLVVKSLPDIARYLKIREM